MKKIIIAIHGLGNKPSQQITKRWLKKSIQEGLNRIGKGRLRIPFELVYWADVFHPDPLDQKIKNPQDPLYLKDPYIKGREKIVEKKSSIRTKLFHYIEEQLDKIFFSGFG